MQEIKPHGEADQEVERLYDRGFEDEDLEPRPFTPPRRSRVFLILGILIALLLMAVLPPLLNVNRYRRQIAVSIGRSLGRPVHIDSVTLNLLPTPGFTLQNFIVTEDPEFGSEPVVRANTVRATLRVRSLWRRRVEFSRIALDEPSVNLVHLSDGRWNVESILLQASRMPAAPTAQKSESDMPRFPYIEATGARVNIKAGFEKLPASLTETKLALWLPQPEQWQLRLEGRPTRTDTRPTDTGTLRIEGTLGRAASLAAVPVDLQGEWLAAPLGAVSLMLVGRDAGFRGDMILSASVRGTVGENVTETRLQLHQVRRADFVPANLLDVDLACRARASELFHALHDVRCTSPAIAAPYGMLMTAEIPETMKPEQADLTARVKDVPAPALLDGLRVLSARISPDLRVEGTGDGTFNLHATPASVAPKVEGQVTITGARVFDKQSAPILNQDVAGEVSNLGLDLHPVALNLGASNPALLEVHADWNGYRLHLNGFAMRKNLLALAEAVPQLGDGLVDALPAAPINALAVMPMRIDLTAIRTWRGGQAWSATSEPRTARRNRRSLRHP